MVIMLVLEQVSVISDLQGTKECRKIQLSSSRRNNNSKDNRSVVKFPSSISIMKSNLSAQPPGLLEPCG